MNGLLQVDLTAADPLEELSSYGIPHWDFQGPEFFRWLKCLGFLPEQKSILHELGDL